MVCPFCNSLLPDNSLFCPACGRRLFDRAQAPQTQPQPQGWRNTPDQPPIPPPDPRPAPRRKGLPVWVWILMGVVIAAAGVTLWLLLRPKREPEPEGEASAAGAWAVSKAVTHQSNGHILVSRYIYNEAGQLTEVCTGREYAHYAYQYDDMGRMTEEFTYEEGSHAKERRIEYSGAGLPFRELLYLDGTFVQITEYQTDAEGRVTEERVLNSSGSLRERITKSFNAAGQCVREACYDGDGNIEKSTEWDYDAAGNKTKEIRYGVRGRITEWYEWEYDDQGREIRYSERDRDGTVGGWREFRYNDAGLLIRTEDHAAIYAGAVSASCEYEYDSAGRQTKKTNYDEFGERSEWEERQYDAAGRETEVSLFYSGWESPRRRTVSVYEDGNLIRVMKYESNQDGEQELDSWEEYEYDDSGNQTKKTPLYPLDRLTREFDAEGRCVRELQTGESYDPWRDAPGLYEYVYDEAGRRTGRTRSIGGVQLGRSDYDYDEKGVLIRMDNCDAAGELTEHRYEYDGAGLLKTESVYEEDGSLRGRGEYEYDAAGKLIAFTVYLQNKIKIRAVYEYDAEGRNTAKNVFSGDGEMDYRTEYEYAWVPNRAPNAD